MEFDMAAMFGFMKNRQGNETVAITMGSVEVESHALVHTSGEMDLWLVGSLYLDV